MLSFRTFFLFSFYRCAAGVLVLSVTLPVSFMRPVGCSSLSFFPASLVVSINVLYYLPTPCEDLLSLSLDCKPFEATEFIESWASVIILAQNHITTWSIVCLEISHRVTFLFFAVSAVICLRPVSTVTCFIPVFSLCSFTICPWMRYLLFFIFNSSLFPQIIFNFQISATSVLINQTFTLFPQTLEHYKHYNCKS